MKSLASILAVLLLIPAALSGESGISKMVGTYAECAMACTAIRINPDLTFDHYLSGDLWPTIRLKGKLKLLGDSTVIANSDEQPTGVPKVTEEVAEDNNSLQVRAMDAAGGLMPGIRIRGKSKSRKFDIETDNRGIAAIPYCDEFQLFVPWLRQSWPHKISLPGANRFTIQLTMDQMFPENFIVNEKWVIRNNMLYFVLDDGQLSYGMERINKDREKQFFPDK
jgi:hypothetical protein